MEPEGPAEQRALERSLLLAAPPGLVYDVLSEPTAMSAWLAHRASATPGGFVLEWDTGAHAERLACVVRERVAGRRFVFRWESALRGHETTAAFDLRPEQGGRSCRLVLREVGFGTGAEWEGVVSEHAEGWDEVLAKLAHVVGRVETRRIEREVRVEATLERVFGALTDAAELRRWLAAHVELVPRAGEPYRIADPEFPGCGRGHVLAVDAGRALALSCAFPGDAHPLTEVRVDLAPEGDAAVRVHVAHSGWSPARTVDALYAEAEEGWEDALALLHRYLRGG